MLDAAPSTWWRRAAADPSAPRCPAACDSASARQASETRRAAVSRAADLAPLHAPQLETAGELRRLRITARGGLGARFWVAREPATRPSRDVSGRGSPSTRSALLAACCVPRYAPAAPRAAAAASARRLLLFAAALAAARAPHAPRTRRPPRAAQQPWSWALRRWCAALRPIRAAARVLACGARIAAMRRCAALAPPLRPLAPPSRATAPWDRLAAVAVCCAGVLAAQCCACFSNPFRLF